MFKKARAGGYARGRYREGLRSWRKQNRWLFALIAGPFVIAGIAVGIATGDFLPWLGGLCAGGFLALWVVLRDTPPRYVEQWLDGAEGERKTEKALRPFERAGWSVVHDVQRSYGNYDHVAVGRPGVYLLETKKLQGVVEIRDGVPHLSRRHDPESRPEEFDRIPRRARSAAASLKREIEQRTGYRTWVQAVVVFWADFPEGLVEVDRCVFIHGSRLSAWMESRPNRLTPAQTEEVAAGVAEIVKDAAGDDQARDTAEPTLA
jgi:Nuclease-related domain